MAPYFNPAYWQEPGAVAPALPEPQVIRQTPLLRSFAGIPANFYNAFRVAWHANEDAGRVKPSARGDELDLRERPGTMFVVKQEVLSWGKDYQPPDEALYGNLPLPTRPGGSDTLVEVNDMANGIADKAMASKGGRKSFLPLAVNHSANYIAATHILSVSRRLLGTATVYAERLPGARLNGGQLMGLEIGVRQPFVVGQAASFRHKQAGVTYINRVNEVWEARYDAGDGDRELSLFGLLQQVKTMRDSRAYGIS
jgi:hypothetical protein